MKYINGKHDMDQLCGKQIIYLGKKQRRLANRQPSINPDFKKQTGIKNIYYLNEKVLSLIDFFKLCNSFASSIECDSFIDLSRLFINASSR